MNNLKIVSKFIFRLLVIIFIQLLMICMFAGCELVYDVTNSEWHFLKLGDSYYPYSDYFVEKPMIKEENYVIELTMPLQDTISETNDPPLILAWKVHEDFPNEFWVEFNYDGCNSVSNADRVYYQSAYVMQEELWNRLKKDAPIVDGVQKIYWRVSINYTTDLEKEPYHSEWSYFFIKTE